MSRRLHQSQSVLEIRGRIIAIKEVEKTKREIAEDVGLSLRQVQSWISRYANDNGRPLQTLPRTGRRPVLQENDVNIIVEFNAQRPFTGSIRQKFYGVEITPGTMFNIFKQQEVGELVVAFGDG
ncbi:hypothetical protein QE152_g8142 [Popillia japonica]|uniref:Transposase n=1 Tax=Popillia japonica TaxID=7064 RepID=A0AAW1MCL6_POPJA